MISPPRLMLRFRLLTLALLASITSGCEQESSESTGVLVVIDAHESVRAEASSLRVLVEVEEDDKKVVRLDERKRAVTFPQQVALVPKGGDATRTFTVTATALDASGGFLSQARIISGFVQNRLLSTVLWIEGNGCLRKECDDTDTCQVGRCSSATRAPRSLSEGLDAGAEQVGDGDGGVVEDARVAPDARMSLDARAAADGAADASACGANGTGVCLRDDAREFMLCADGVWVTAICPENQRCEAKSGSCREIVPACATRHGGEQFCRGNERLTCDPDRVNVTSEQCPSGQVCVLSAGKTSCVSDRDECQAAEDDCDDMPDACLNTQGGYQCRCPDGYDGDGKGTNGCVDRNECAAGTAVACGAGATACMNTPGGRSCACGAGCTPSSSSGACVAPDACARGPVTVCGTGATACNNTACSFSCSCNPGYAVAADGQSCRARTWGMATTLESDTVSAMVPAVAVDGAGNAIAVWYQGAFGARSVFASRNTGASGWTAPAAIEQAAGDTGGPNDAMWGPQIAMNTAGVAFAVWEQSDGTRSNIWAARNVNGMWDAPALVENNDAGNARLPYVTVDSAGNALAVWFQSDGVRNRIYANRYVNSSGAWGSSATVISTDATGDAGNARIAADSAGNAMAVWEQTNPSAANTFHIWAARYSAGSWAAATRIEERTPGNAWNPAVAVDAAGNATAVWYKQDADDTSRTSIWAKRFNGTAWGAVAALEGSTSGAAATSVAMDAAGNAIATWYQHDGQWDSVYTSRYVAGSWGTAERMELQNNGNARNPVVALDGSGNAVLAWYQWDGARTDIYTKRSIGGAWASEVRIDSDNTGFDWLPALAVSSAGNAVAVWTRFDVNPLFGMGEIPNITAVHGDALTSRLE